MFGWRWPKVLTYHTVLPERGQNELFSYAQPTTEEFEDQIRFLSSRCSPLTLEQYLEVVNGRGVAPRRSVLITFDDGYKHTELTAEIMGRHEVPFVLFPAVDFLDVHRWPWFLALDWMLEHTRLAMLEFADVNFGLQSLSARKFFASVSRMTISGRRPIASRRCWKTLLGVWRCRCRQSCRRATAS